MRALVALALLATLGGCLQVDVMGWSGPENPGPDAPPSCGASDDRENDGVSDADEGTGDADGDGIPNALDIDSDGDRIQDVVEAGDADCRTPPVDTDGDGTPDFLDHDSDGDGILDVHEGVADPDRDGVFAFRDLDADGDGVIDRIEAGDRDPATAPGACPSFLDADSDDDGLADGEERALGTAPCLVDTDEDGRDDLHEATWARFACPDGAGEACDCGRDAACVPPDAAPFLRLAPGDGPARRDVALEARVRALDALILVDVSRGESDLVLAALRNAMRPGSGLFDQVRAAVSDLRLAVAEHSDFAFAPWGGAGDVPFHLLAPVTEVDDDAPEPTGRAALAEAFAALAGRAGGDAPGSHLEAVFQALTGAGGAFSRQGGAPQRIPPHADECAGDAFGAPCFRPDAVPLLLHVTGTCGHGGPPGESAACDDYAGLSPMPARWDEVVDAAVAAGARYVGVNTSTAACGRGPEGTATAPCRLLGSLARETRTTGLDGEPVVADVGGRVLSEVEARLVDVLRRGVEDVPLDATVALALVRTDPDGAGDPVRAWAETRCVARGVTRCWSSDYEPEDEAVSYTDRATFYGVAPATRVEATVAVEAPTAGEARSRTFAATVDLDTAGPRAARLDRRVVLVAVPARGW